MGVAGDFCRFVGVAQCNLHFFAGPMSQGGISYAALVLRRRREKEKRVYRELFPYSAEDYEVLLRYWTEEPYLNYLTAICSPVNTGDSPEIALMKRVFEWSKELAREAGYPDQGVIRGILNYYSI